MYNAVISEAHSGIQLTVIGKISRYQNSVLTPQNCDSKAVLWKHCQHNFISKQMNQSVTGHSKATQSYYVYTCLVMYCALFLLLCRFCCIFFNSWLLPPFSYFVQCKQCKHCPPGCHHELQHSWQNTFTLQKNGMYASSSICAQKRINYLLATWQIYAIFFSAYVPKSAR